jgi:hypothetical protein
MGIVRTRYRGRATLITHLFLLKESSLTSIALHSQAVARSDPSSRTDEDASVQLRVAGYGQAGEDEKKEHHVYNCFANKYAAMSQ